MRQEMPIIMRSHTHTPSSPPPGSWLTFCLHTIPRCPGEDLLGASWVQFCRWHGYQSTDISIRIFYVWTWFWMHICTQTRPLIYPLIQKAPLWREQVPNYCWVDWRKSGNFFLKETRLPNRAFKPMPQRPFSNWAGVLSPLRQHPSNCTRTGLQCWHCKRDLSALTNN